VAVAKFGAEHLTLNTENSTAWQPLTPRGIAAFARAPLWRLLLAHFLFALAAAIAVVWAVRSAWFPVIGQAIRRLPAQGEVHRGVLDWPETAPQLLAENHFLALAVDPGHSGAVRSPAHVDVEFGRKEIRFFAVLGYVDFPYPPTRDFPLNRSELEPWWGAWAPPLSWIALAAAIPGFLALWLALALVYFFPGWLAGYFANRELDLFASFKLAGAATMPGVLLAIAGILFYAFGAFDPLRLAAGFAAQFVSGWIYLFLAVMASPKLASAAQAKKNPFSTGDS